MLLDELEGAFAGETVGDIGALAGETRVVAGLALLVLDVLEVAAVAHALVVLVEPGRRRAREAVRDRGALAREASLVALLAELPVVEVAIAARLLACFEGGVVLPGEHAGRARRRGRAEARLARLVAAEALATVHVVAVAAVDLAHVEALHHLARGRTRHAVVVVGATARLAVRVALQTQALRLEVPQRARVHARLQALRPQLGARASETLVRSRAFAGGARRLAGWMVSQSRSYGSRCLPGRRSRLGIGRGTNCWAGTGRAREGSSDSWWGPPLCRSRKSRGIRSSHRRVGRAPARTGSSTSGRQLTARAQAGRSSTPRPCCTWRRSGGTLR